MAHYENLISQNWKDYELISVRRGMKKERWGKYVLLRPDPQILWNGDQWSDPKERQPDAVYHRSQQGGGGWEFHKPLPESWEIQYKDLRFKITPTPFKHTGLFPEQAINWDWMRERVRMAKAPQECLNLFGYSGGATVALAKEGARVSHVDASKGMTTWCRENAILSGLADAPIRYLVEDCLKYVEREVKRGRKYDGIVLDPPSFGRGNKGQVWKFESDLPILLERLLPLLSNRPNFILLNAYTTGISPFVLANLMEEIFSRSKHRFSIQMGELLLPFSCKPNHFLPCGLYCRLSFEL
jgi:23S rRNA (cytosine1962-C5)-methyltransferase